ncbi:MAG: gamma carbonic anhydrase family protein [Pseudomonadota bacterium]|nr:gamma carbonic anhydrase family protein [Pseudomonadota bacterium]
MIYSLGKRKPFIEESVFIAPDAAIIGDVELHSKSSIWFNVVLRGDIEKITVGSGSNIQDGSVVHTDPENPCTLGENVTVGHMAMLHGCKIGNHSLIGIGATLLNGSEVGENSIIGAHSLLTENKKYPDNVLILGAPAKVIREITPQEKQSLRDSAERYKKRANDYQSRLQNHLEL